MVYALNVGPGSYVFPGFGARCSTHRKLKHPGSQRPSMALLQRKKIKSDTHASLQRVFQIRALINAMG